jgi:hypothetical protein
VQLAEDGNLDFMGRIDQQVKIRGFRIELNEIEAALLQNPAVKHAVVTLRDNATGGKRLVAYTVGSPAAELSASGLKEHLQKILPEYMIPATFVSLEELPLTPNGKVDRANLPEPGPLEEVRGAHFVGPRTPIEQVLTSIWEEILRVRGIGIFDNFFELGGDSLLALKLHSRIQQMGFDIKIFDILEMETISRLATRIALSYGNESDDDSDDIVAFKKNLVSFRELKERGREMAIRASQRKLGVEEIMNLMQVADSVVSKFRQSAVQALVKGYEEGIAENKQPKVRHGVDEIEAAKASNFNKEQ